jgi:hypothetical protein
VSNDFSHKLLHIVVKSDEADSMDRYIHKHIAFASMYVARQIAAKFEKSNKADMLAFLRGSAGEANASSLRGNLFEGHAHNMLLRGGTFNIRDLASGVPDSVTFEPSNEVLLGAAADVNQLTKQQYGRPISKTFCAVDSVMRSPCYLFQMTVSQDHGIKVHGLEALLPHLPPAKQYILYLVVPEGGLLWSMKLQTFQTVGGGKLKQGVDKWKKQIQQVVLEMPLTSAVFGGGVSSSSSSQAPAKSLPVNNPPAKNPPAKNPPAKNPPTKNPPAKNPPIKSPPTKKQKLSSSGESSLEESSSSEESSLEESSSSEDSSSSEASPPKKPHTKQTTQSQTILGKHPICGTMTKQNKPCKLNANSCPHHKKQKKQ